MTSPIIAPDKSRNSALDLIAGPFASAVATIWSGDRSANYFAATDARRHVWHCCLSAPSAVFPPRNLDESALTCERLTWGRAKDLILQAYGCAPRGITGVLSRLTPAPLEPAIYPLLVRILEVGGDGAKFLMHHRAPFNELIACVATAPSGFPFPMIFGLLDRGQIRTSDLPYIAWTLDRLALPQAERARVLSSRHVTETLIESVLGRPFPAAPWAGTNRLSPVTSRADMVRAAERFANCLRGTEQQRSVTLNVLSGMAYYYLWEGDECALLKFVRLLDIGWYLGESAGVGNKELSFATRIEIGDELRSADNLHPGYLLINPRGDRGSKFWFELLSGLS
jgi:hypothetical protein